MPPRTIPGYMSETELSVRLDMTVWGLRAWRRRGYGPVPVKFGRSIFYSNASVENFSSNPSFAS